MFRPIEWLQLAVGSLFIPTGLLFLIGGLAAMPERNQVVFDSMMIAALGALPLILGVWLWVRVLRARRRRRDESRERTILGLASQRGGRLTVQALALETDLTLREAKAALETLHVDGHCVADVGDDGEMAYLFKV